MKDIILSQFRCFERFDMSFKRGLNVLVGDNANGKTSILRACKFALSAFFVGFSDENTRLLTPNAEDFRLWVNDSGVRMPVKPLEISFSWIFPLQDDNPSPNYLRCASENKDSRIRFGLSAVPDDLPSYKNIYKIGKKNPKNSRLVIGGMKGYKAYCKELQKNMYVESVREKPLPVFVSFSTEDIHANRKISSKRFSTLNQSASFGYYECLEARGLFKYWKKRMLVLAEAEEGEQELEVVKNAVLKAFDGIISNIEIRINEKKIYFEFEDRRKVAEELLSDGYRRLLNIVVDIAFRAALLNRELYGDKAAMQSEGTVLIDEIDMHLHPSLQATILQRLQQTFPKIQFIVSTHSPMVMSNLKSDENNVIYKLDYKIEQKRYEARDVKAYGRDISSVVETVLDILPRNKETEERLRGLFDCIDEDKLEEAKVKLAELRKDYGDTLPEFVRAETMINFLSDEED